MRLRTIGAAVVSVALLLPTGTVLAQDESPSPEASLSPAAEEFAASFPDEVGGVALAEFIEVISADSPEAMDDEALPLLEEAAVGAGAGLDEVLVGSALTVGLLDEDAEGVWIIAIHVPGMEPTAGTDLLLELFLGSEEEELLITESEIAGRSVTDVASAEDPDVAMTLYGGEGTAWLVAAQGEGLLEEAISKLP